MGQTDVFGMDSETPSLSGDLIFGGATGQTLSNDDAPAPSNGSRRKPVSTHATPSRAGSKTGAGRAALKEARPPAPLKLRRFRHPQASADCYSCWSEPCFSLLLSRSWPSCYGGSTTKPSKGALQFRGSSSLSGAQRTDLKIQQQQLLADPAVRRQALESRSRQGSDCRVPRASPADATDFSALAASAEWDDKGDQLVFTRSGTDAGDRPRMGALLEALYAQNRSLNDEAGALHAAYTEAARKADFARSKLEDLDGRIRNDRNLADSADALKAKAAETKASLESLVRDLDATEGIVRALEAEIKPLEPSVTVTEAPTTAPTTAPVVALNPDDDEQVKELTAEQEQLKARLKSAKDARDAQASGATMLLDGAQKEFDKQIEAARKVAGDGGAMAQFLTTLKRWEDNMRQGNAELIQQQEEDRQSLDDLKERLTRANAARIKKLWDEDEGLKELQQKLAIAEHHYNTAVGVELPKDADAITAEMAQLNKRIKTAPRAAGEEGRLRSDDQGSAGYNQQDRPAHGDQSAPRWKTRSRNFCRHSKQQSLKPRNYPPSSRRWPPDWTHRRRP